jgi:FlgD Ig-like domain
MQPTELTPSRRAVRALAALLIGGVAAVAVTPWPAGAVVDFTFTTPNAIKVGPANIEYIKVDCVISNTGTEADEYDILRRVQAIPAAWLTSICIGGNDGLLANGLPGGCQAPFVDSLYANTPPCGFPSCGGPTDFGLNPGQNDTISCYVTPNSTEGSGYATFTVRSTVNPAVTRTLVLGAVSDGIEILVMDDDGAQTLETFYQAAIPGFIPSGTWHRALDAASAAELANFTYVVWFTGNAVPGLDATDRTALATYLTGGGKLVLTGQDVAFDLCDPASPNFSMANVTWYETNLKTRYVSNNSNSTNITGIAGDPISNGLNLAIQGGTGANNQTDPDVLRSLAGAGNVWTYGAGNLVAATKVVNQGNRAVNLGFGFEAIANAADRQTVMQRMIEWLGASPVGIADADAPGMPAAIEIEPARPNPFNPATILAFRLQSAGAVELRIIDTRGHVVRVLVAGERTAGRHEVSWDGRDAEGREVASGVYVAEVAVAGSGADRTKLMLVR